MNGADGVLQLCALFVRVALRFGSYAPRCSEDELVSYSSSELRETFEHFDGDDNGRIDREEFRQLMEALGADMTEEELAVGFSMIDSDDDGSIDYDEFEDWWNDR